MQNNVVYGDHHRQNEGATRAGWFNYECDTVIVVSLKRLGALSRARFSVETLGEAYQMIDQYVDEDTFPFEAQVWRGCK